MTSATARVPADLVAEEMQVRCSGSGTEVLLVCSREALAA